jgi:methyl-CpG-binding domain protein 4
MLQEDLWPNQWKILVACILHNQTSRKQVDKVYQDLFYNYPDAASLSVADQNFLARMLKPLGLHNRRSKSLIRFSREYLEVDWTKPSDLYACGKYADDCYKVFCTGKWQEVEPSDHALNMYHDFLREKFLSQEVKNARRT